MSNNKKINPNAFVADKVTKKIIDENRENAPNYLGVNNKVPSEIRTNYNKSLGETVINSTSNAFIILGRDRDAGIASGLGGKGYTGAAAIDIVVGHMGPWPVDRIYDQKVISEKDFKNDSARLYISQLSDVDSYFNIPKVQAKLGSSVIDLEHGIGLSTVAAKADTVRLIARENVKVVTFHNSVTSTTGKAINGGIDIVAGCNVMGVDKTLSLQPMVKGNNLTKLLQELISRIDDVGGVLSSFMKKQREINNILSQHTHQSSKAGLPTSTIVGDDASLKNFSLLTEVLPDIIQTFIYNSSISGEYFTPTSDLCIYSNWNRVN